MSGRRGVIVSAAFAVLVTAVAASSATAATKRFNPLDFASMSSADNVLRSPIAIGAGATFARFAAPLALRPGARVTGIRIYSNGVAAGRSARLVRLNSSGESMVASVVTSDASPDLFTPILTNGSVDPDPTVATIQPNWLYSVQVNCSANTAVWAVDVDFIP